MSRATLLRRALPFVALAAIVALAVAGGIDLAESAQHIRGASPGWLLVAVIAVMAMRVCRAWRWAGLFPLAGLERPPFAKQVQIILAVDSVNSFLPRAATMASRGLLAARVYGCGLRPVAATLALELVVDTAVLALLAAALVPYLLWGHGALAGLLAAGAALGVVVAGAAGPAALHGLAGATGRLPLPGRLAALERVQAALPPRDALPALLRRAVVATVASHTCRIAAFVAVALAVGGLPVLPVVAATVISAPAQLFPFTIGGAGVREGLLVLVLAHFGVTPELGVALGVTVLLVSSGSALAGAILAPRLLFAKRPADTAEVMERSSAA